MYAFQVHLIFGQLSGLKTIGNGGDYPDLHAAIQDLNANGLDGNTILEIKDGFDQTRSYTIHSYPGMDQYKLTIRPEPGASEVILRSSSGTVIWLDSLNNVTIDGRPGGESNQCVLKLLHSNKFNSSTIWADRSKNTIIRNCLVRFDGTRGVDLMYSDSSIVENCDIATYSNGPITNNTTIGIEINRSSNTVVKNNVIHDLHVDSVFNISGIETYAPDPKISTDSIYNNFIAINTGAVDSSVYIQGIRILDGVGNQTYLYFNTVVIGGNNINGEVYSSYALNYEIYGEAIVENNIFINKRSNAFGTAKHYCLSINSSGTPTLVSDHNLLLCDDVDGILGNYSDDYSTLADWQNNTGFDLNSVTKDVVFEDAAAGDLHLSGNSLTDSDLYCTFIDGINDIDNEVRWADSTYMGADQPSVIEPCIPDPENDPDNILKNGNFGACTLSPWNLYYLPSLGVSAKAELIDGTCEVSATSLSTDPVAWDIQLNQEMSSSQLGRLEQGCRYELNFDAFSDKDNSHMRISFEQSVNPLANIFNEEIMLSTENHSYSFEFILDTIYQNTQLSLQVGLDTTTTIIDNVKLRKKTDTISVPGIIEAEEFNAMQGIQSIPTSDTSGGSDITSASAGDWLEYSINIPSSGQYTISYRVAGLGDGQIAFLQNGEFIDTLDIPGMGGEQVWQTVNTVLNLTEGSQTIRLLILAGNWSMNWWSVEEYIPTILNQVSTKKELIYPNPVTGILHINAEEGSHIKLFDSSGRRIKEFILLSSPVHLDLSDLPVGIYMLKIDEEVHKITIIR